MGKRIPIDEQYWRDRSTVDADTECWIWKGKPKKSGYGCIKRDGRFFMPHRLAYATFHGPIPDGLVVLHSCDNPVCVNPQHLTAGTQKSNIQDMYQKGRGPNRRGENGASAKLTWEQVAAIRADTGSGNAIAARYQVHPSLISRIRANKYWVVPIADHESTL